MKIDARIKILIVVATSTCAVLYNNIYMLLALLALSLILTFASGCSFIDLFRRSYRFISLVVVLTLLHSILTREGNVLIGIGNFAIVTDYGLAMAGSFFLRMMIIISTGLFISSSSSDEVIYAFVWYRVPYSLAVMTHIGIAFVPIFREEFSNRLDALSLRGIDIKSLKFRQKANLYIYLLTPTIKGSMMRSETLAASLDTRGFRLKCKRTYLNTYLVPLYNYAVLIIHLSIVGMISYYNWILKEN